MTAKANGRKPATKNRLPKAKAPTKLEIPDLDFQSVTVRIIGTAPLVVHRWGAKASAIMFQSQRGVKRKKVPKNPVERFLDTIPRCDVRDEIEAYDEHGDVITDYDGELMEHMPIWGRFVSDDNSGWGFPAAAFREAMVRAGKSLDLKMTDVRTQLSVRRIYVPIIPKEDPHCRFDHVRVSQTADLRFRGQFDEWETELTVQHCPQILATEMIFQLIRYAGMFVGIGEMRPEKKVGSFGTFTFDPNKALVEKL